MRFSTPIGHPEQREGSVHAYLDPQPQSPRLNPAAFAMRLADPSFHGLFAILTTRFSQDDDRRCGFPPQLVILSNAKDLYMHT